MKHTLILTLIMIELLCSILLTAQTIEPGNCLYFDGSDDYVQVNKAVIPTSGDFTVEVWINSDTDIGGYREILSQDAGTGGTNFYMGMSNTNIIRIGDGWTNTGISFPLDGKWHQLTVSKSDAITKLYLDGTVVATQTSIGNPTGSTFRIGKQFGDHDEYFKGKIDELRIWNIVRSPEEIQANMDTCLKGSEAGLVAWYNFNSGTASSVNTDSTILKDLTENENNGTLTNFALTNATSNWVESYAMVVPTATGATGIEYKRFIANWEAPVIGFVDTYFLDVSTDSTFSSFVPGYNSLPISADSTSIDVRGLTSQTTYYFRIHAKKNSVTGEGAYSNVISLATIPSPYNLNIYIVDTLLYTENDEATFFDPNSSVVYDDEMANLTNGSLTVQVISNLQTSDQILIDTSGLLTIEDKTLNYNDTLIANIRIMEGLASGDTALSINFTENITTARAQYILQSITYQNLSETPHNLKTIRISVSDYYGSTGTDTCIVNIKTINDAPYEVSNKKLDVYASLVSWATVYKLVLRYTDDDNEESNLSYTITQLPTQGNLSKTGTNMALSETFTQEDINLGLIKYTYTGAGNTIEDSCIFLLTDGENTLTNICLRIKDKKPFANGSGTKEDPYLVSTKEELNNIRWLLDSYFLQTSNINFDNDDFKQGGFFYNEGKGWIPIGDNASPFTGSYEGDGNTIKNIYMYQPSVDYLGLFGKCTYATINGLGVINAVVEGRYYVGALVGHNSGKVSNCFTSGKVRGHTSTFDQGTGGLVGYNTDTVINCYSFADVRGDYDVGGLVGDNIGIIENSYSTGRIIGYNYVGGLAGFNGTKSIKSCYSTSHTTGNSNIGGLVGLNYSLIENTYATGWVSGNQNIGGLIGYNTSTVRQSYSTGQVTGSSRIGGFIGDRSGTVANCFWDTETSGLTIGIGNGLTNGATGLTTISMKQPTDNNNWFLTDIWGIMADSIYPALLAVDNAPFAFCKTDTVGASLSFSRLMANDFDNETLQSSIICTITNKGACTVKKEGVYLPSSATAGDVYTIYYRIGEARASKNDTLWGNITKSILLAKANTAPQWLGDLFDYSIGEDNILNIKLSTLVNDNEGDVLQYNFLSTSENGSQEIIANSLQYFPDKNFYGTDSLQIIVSDGVMSDTSWITIEVKPVNDAPVITSTAQTVATEDVEYNYDIAAFDVENSSLAYSLLNAPDGMHITDNEITWTPTEGILTSGEVTLTVSDGELSDTETFSITVNPVNDAPVISSTAPVTASEDEKYTYSVAAIDAEDSTLTYSLENAPDGMLISDGEITWTPAEGILTSGEVTLTVSDGELSVTKTFTITVNPVNDKPVITSVAPATATEDEEFSYIIIVTDAEDSTLTYSLENAPDGMLISDREITWTPTEGILTSGVVTLLVSDGELSDTETFTITVKPVNDAPVISSTAPVIASEDEKYTYSVAAIDAEDSTLTYSLENAPEGMLINDGEITWTPTEGILTSGAVTLTVSDGELSDTETFTITVNPVNDAPVIISTAPLKALWKKEYTYTVEVRDVDNEFLSYSLTGAPEGMVLTGNIITWTPGDGVTTSGEIALTVSDGEGAAIQRFTISVTEANNAPAFTSVTAQTITKDQSLEIILAMTDATDADGDVLVLVIGSGENYTVAGNTITPVDGFTGTLSVPLSVSDGVDNSAVVNMEITVTIVDGIPAIHAEEITLYPNPVNNILWIAGVVATAKANVYDLHGNLLLVGEITEQRPLQVSLLPQGMYIIRIVTDRGVIERKIMKTGAGSL